MRGAHGLYVWLRRRALTLAGDVWDASVCRAPRPAPAHANKPTLMARRALRKHHTAAQHASCHSSVLFRRWINSCKCAECTQQGSARGWAAAAAGAAAGVVDSSEPGIRCVPGDVLQRFDHIERGSQLGAPPRAHEWQTCCAKATYGRPDRLDTGRKTVVDAQSLRPSLNQSRVGPQLCSVAQRIFQLLAMRDQALY